VTRFALVGFLDFLNQELRVLVRRASLELRAIFRQAERERRVYPVQEAGVIRFIGRRAICDDRCRRRAGAFDPYA
jgi:hypothetical protein